MQTNALCKRAKPLVASPALTIHLGMHIISRRALLASDNQPMTSAALAPSRKAHPTSILSINNHTCWALLSITPVDFNCGRKITADLLVDSRQRQRGKPHVPLPPCISELVLRCGYAPARFAHLAGIRMLEGRVTEVNVHVAVVRREERGVHNERGVG